jgi:hypothetical protein
VAPDRWPLALPVGGCCWRWRAGVLVVAPLLTLAGAGPLAACALLALLVAALALPRHRPAPSWRSPVLVR